MDSKQKDAVQSRLITLLKKYKILFNKSQLVTIKKQKDKALSKLQKDYLKEFDITITAEQIKRKIQKMKGAVRKKLEDEVALSKWEIQFLDLMNTSVPFKVKMPAVKESDSTCGDLEISKNSLDNSTPQTDTESNKHTLVSEDTINEIETQETRMLSTQALNRLVLLEQLKLARIQIAKEEGWMKVLAQKKNTDLPKD